MIAGVPLGQILSTGGGWLVAVAAAGFAVWLVLTGKLVPHSQLEDVQADRDSWRTSHDTQQQITLKQGLTLERLLVLAETSATALQAIQTARGRGDDLP